ncbi:hypothetical protein COO60DRAFT_1272092 [Scenedesmus sp. NREL 46B-D3]|nr:hypothetical protein COO60DRAFT_1272092 [Scenedesmus sp. NREL 46B-D3]
MSYDEVEIEDMKWDEQLQAYTYSCPCGDLFQITLDQLKAGEEIARCPSCSLYITVIYDQVGRQCTGKRVRVTQDMCAAHNSTRCSGIGTAAAAATSSSLYRL